MGLLIAYIGAIDYLPNYGVEVYPFGYIPIYLHLLIYAYAIVRYKFLDIEVIVKKTLVFAGLMAFVLAVFSGISLVARRFFEHYLGASQQVSFVISMLVVVLAYDGVRGWLVGVTDRFLFQKKFKLTTIITQASQAISLIQSLKWLSRRIVAFLVTTCRLKNAAIYTRDRDRPRFTCLASRGFKQEERPPDLLHDASPLVRYLGKIRSPLDVNHLREEIARDPALKATGDEIMDFFKAAHAEVVIPSFLMRRIEMTGIGKERTEKDSAAELRNIVVLGGKKSDELYSEEELEIFHGLAQESAIAIENARLYDEAIQRTRLLGQINKELSDANEKLRVTQASLIVAEKNATMVGMAKAIGHEVNNPLSTVMYRVETIYKDRIKKCRGLVERNAQLIPPGDLESLHKLMLSIEDDGQRAGKAAQRINVVVHTLTNILRNTKGEMSALNVNVLCREAIEATRFSTYEENLAGCAIDVDIASNVNILGNLEQLLQVFVNLIKNSYEAMGAQKERKVAIRADFDAADKNMAFIEFSDNGPGIPPDVLPRIWVQGFSTKTRSSDRIGAAGQGQGLFVCKHIIESVHKGTITVRSTPGEGTAFAIKLPLAEVNEHV